MSVVNGCQSSKAKRKRDDVSPAPETVPKPLIKWVGGKTQILEKVIKKFPSVIENYYEPFVGGGSVLLRLLHAEKQGTIRVKGTIYASDLSHRLIGFYRMVQREPDALLDQVRFLQAECPRNEGEGPADEKCVTREEAQSCAECYFYWIKNKLNALTPEETQTPKGAAIFYFLNETGYNGLYRVNSKDIFNVAFGKRNPSTIDEFHLRRVSKLLQPVVFQTRSFTDISPFHFAAGDFLYLDPPYVPIKKTSFHMYTKEGFRTKDHNNLFRWCHEIKDKGIHLLMSNADAPLVREKFDSRMWTIEKIDCRRQINSENPGAIAKEVLITYTPLLFSC